MIDYNLFFIKKDKKWQYYPFGPVVRDVVFDVKDGCKKEFQKALEIEPIVARIITPILVCFGILNIYLTSLLVLYLLYFFYNRKRIEKKYCHYGEYSCVMFFKYYLSIVYYFLDEKNNKQYLKTIAISALLFFASFVNFRDGKRYFGCIFMIGFILALYLVVLITIKKIRSCSANV